MQDTADYLSYWFDTMESLGIKFTDKFQYMTQQTRQCAGNCGIGPMIDEGIVLNIPFANTLEQSLALLYKDITFLELPHQRCQQTEVMQTEKLVVIPQFLLMQLKRDFIAGKKNQTPCVIPEYLDFGPHMGKFTKRNSFLLLIDNFPTGDAKTPKIFRCAAINCHTGATMTSGHYLSFTRNG